MTDSKTDKDETAGAVDTDEDTTADTPAGSSAATDDSAPDSDDSADTTADGSARSGEGSVDASDATPGSAEASTDSHEGPGADSAPTDEGDGDEEAGSREGRASVGETELVALREEFEELNDRHLRLAAEFNNFRRRSEQERLAAWARAQADLVGDLVDVLDDLHRVADLDLSNATVENIMEGIDLVERKFMRKLEEAGVEVIEPKDDAFDPERMEAMMRVPAEDDDQVDTVAEVFQKGYSLKGILVRPARVSVYTQG